MTMTSSFLTTNEALMLRERHRKSRRRQDADRIKAILLLDKGWSYSEIEEVLLLDESTVRRYRIAYVDGGLIGLLKTNYTGRAPLLSSDQQAELFAHLNDHIYLDSMEIIAYIQETFFVTYSRSGVTHLLHRLGMSYKKPKVVPAKADVDEQAKFVVKYDEIREAGHSVYFMDGTHPSHNSMPAHGWIPTGKDAEIKTNSGRDRININGAFNIDTLNGVFDFTDSVNAQSTISILNSVDESRNENERVFVICDNAKYYRSKLVSEWRESHSHTTLLFLPPYSPNLNLIERLWKYFKKVTLYNKYYKTYELFRSAAVNFFGNLSAHSENLATLMVDNFQEFNMQTH